MNWNDDKNALLKNNRDITFEEIAFLIHKNQVIEITNHPNQLKYPGQRIFVLKVRNYIYLVPFIETETEVFLKTIIPSRKATKRYLNKEGDNNEKDGAR